MLSSRVIGYFRLFQRFYLLLAVAFVLFIGWKHSSDIGSAFRNLNAMSFNVVFFLVTLAFFSYSCRTLRWLQYMQLKQNSASLKCHILIYFSGFAFTVTPGKTGELMRGAYLSDVGVPFRFTFCAFFSERLLDVIAVSLLGSYFFTENYSVLFILITISIVFFYYFCSINF